MNDAKGCFDRIVHSVAILVLMSFGVSGYMARTLFKVLQEADHHMKTGFGRSKQAYGNEKKPTKVANREMGLDPLCGP